MSSIRFSTFPRTAPPPVFVPDIVSVFEAHSPGISTVELAKGLTSDQVLARVRPGLIELGFEVEAGKRNQDKIKRPVFFGDDGSAELQYEVDAYHAALRCGLEVEAGRAWMGNAVYRDLIQACVMVEVDYLVLAVPQIYKYESGGKTALSEDYEKTRSVADALFAHSRIQLPYQLVLLGY